MSQLTLREKEESHLTVVEEVQNVSSANAQGPVASAIKTRGSRRPRLSLDEKREIARLYADTSTSTSEICARLGIGESSLYRIVQLQGLRLRGRTASSTPPGTAQPAPAPYMNRNRSPNAGRPPELKPDSATATSAVRGQAIESDVKQTREPAAGGAKSVTGRRRTAPLARRPRFDAPIQTPAANSAPAPHRDSPVANSRGGPLQRGCPVRRQLSGRADLSSDVRARGTAAGSGAWSD